MQSFAIEQQLQTIAQVAEELRQFYDRLSLVQQRSSTSKFVRSLRMGDREEKELEGILKRLDTAKGDLTVRILVAHVGVVGNFHDGFRVAYDVLAETNLNVQRVLGVNMALLELVENRDRKLGQYDTFDLCKHNISDYKKMEQSPLSPLSSRLSKHPVSMHLLKWCKTRFIAIKASDLL